jgi:hypothetical protein
VTVYSHDPDMREIFMPQKFSMEIKTHAAYSMSGFALSDHTIWISK